MHALDRFMPVARGERVDPLAREVLSPRYANPMTGAGHEWLEEMGVRSVGGFDDFCVTGRVPELIRVAATQDPISGAVTVGAEENLSTLCGLPAGSDVKCADSST